MTSTELRDGFDHAYKQFYGLKTIAKRMFPVPKYNRIEHAAYVVANLKTWSFLRKTPSAWGTIPRRLVFLSELARHRGFRAAVALAFLLAHLLAIGRYASSHLGLPWNRSPGVAPSFAVVDYDYGALDWSRLVVSRWDSGQYIAMALDGVYGHCPPADLRGADLRQETSCDFAFYPGYAALGWMASLGARLPVDYALLGVSLLASFLLLFLWTGPVVVDALGLRGAYVSLLLLNAYTTGFTLVTVQTEPCTMLLTFAALLAVERKRKFAGALLAGAASALRVSGVCASVAFAVALIVCAHEERPRTVRKGVGLALLLPLSAWGQLGLWLFDAWRYSDPFVYQHAHAQLFHHEPQVWHLVAPKLEWIEASMSDGVHEIAVAAAMALWFAIGHRGGLRGLSRPGRAYVYVQFLSTLTLCLYGTAELHYVGLTRYTLAMFGGFFAMGAILGRRPIALALWTALSLWHYWTADSPFFLSHGAQDHIRDGEVERPSWPRF